MACHGNDLHCHQCVHRITPPVDTMILNPCRRLQKVIYEIYKRTVSSSFMTSITWEDQGAGLGQGLTGERSERTSIDLFDLCSEGHTFGSYVSHKRRGDIILMQEQAEGSPASGSLLREINRQPLLFLAETYSGYRAASSDCPMDISTIARWGLAPDLSHCIGTSLRPSPRPERFRARE